MYQGRCLVLGFGSDALSDDGLPIYLVRDLQVIYNNLACDFQTSPIGGIELISLLEGYEAALLIDTQMTSRRNPGEISEFTLSNFEETYHLSSQHDLSFQDTFRLAEMMEIPFPAIIRIVAIEVSVNKTLRFELSETLRDNYPCILSYLCRVLNEMTGRNGKQVT